MRRRTTDPTDPYDAGKLVPLFLAEATRIVRRFGNLVSASCHPDPPRASVFSAEVEGMSDAGAFRIIFGAREAEIRSSIHPTGRPHGQDLATCFAGCGHDSDELHNSMWIFNESRLRAVLARHEEALAVCCSVLGSNPTDFWTKAELQRRREEEAGAEILASAERRRDIARAADAFHHRDWEGVIESLSPHVSRLSEAQRAKLHYAQKAAASSDG